MNGFKRWELGIMTALCLSLGGCAFKESKPPLAVVEVSPAQEISVAMPAPVQAGPEQFLLLSWKKKDSEMNSVPLRRSLRPSLKSQGVLESDQPITLPSQLPDELKLSIRAQFNTPETEDLLVELVALDSNGNENPSRSKPEIISGRLEQSMSTYSLEAKGLEGIFQKPLEGHFSIRVNLRSKQSGRLVKQVLIALRLPPSKIEVEQLTVQQFEQKYGEIQSQSKVLNEGGIRLNLLQVIQLSNPSERSIELTYPRQLKGELRGDYIRHFATESIQAALAECSLSRRQENFSESISQHIFLLPLGTQLNVNELKEDGQGRMPFKQKQKSLFGIYGAGNKLDEIIDQGFRPLMPQDVSVVSSCYASCDRVNRPFSGAYLNQCSCLIDAPNDRCRALVSECRDCTEFGSGSCHKCYMGEQGDAPICYRQKYCLSGWQITYNRVPAKRGVQSLPVVLSLSEETQRLFLRSGDLPLMDDPEMGEVPFLKPETQQFGI